MFIDAVRKILKWMPLILLLMLLMIDRDNTFHKIGYIFLLISYSGVIVLKILHAKKEWHTDPQTSKISGDKNIQKMSDFLEKMDDLGEEE